MSLLYPSYIYVVLHPTEHCRNIKRQKERVEKSEGKPMEMIRSHCKINRADQMRPIQRKKQVRRRIHTIKPYQERLLNMAEARKEIVTALKLHRASMKKEQRQQQQQQQEQPDVNVNVNASIPALIHQIASEQQEVQPTLLDRSYPITVQDYFTNLNGPSFVGSTPSHATTGVNSGVAPETVFKEDQCGGRCEGGAVEPRALDEEEMAEIRCIGEMHQMEWDDTLNLATYAWWFRFLQPMELSEEDGHSVCVPNLD